MLNSFPEDYILTATIPIRVMKRNIQAAKPRLKEEGFLIFNDYTYWSPLESAALWGSAGGKRIVH